MGFMKRLFGRPVTPQQQMESVYVAFLQQLDVILLGRLNAITAAEGYGADGAVASQAVRYCLNRDQNEKLIANTTEQQRIDGDELGARIMSLAVPGIYSKGNLQLLIAQIAELPQDARSVKRIILSHLQMEAILHLSRATSFEAGSPVPLIDTESVSLRALPLVLWALSHDPATSELNATAAQVYYTMRNLDEGFIYAKRAVEADESNAEAWRLAGNAHMMRGENDLARDAFDRALALQPNLIGAREALSLLDEP